MTSEMTYGKALTSAGNIPHDDEPRIIDFGGLKEGDISDGEELLYMGASLCPSDCYPNFEATFYGIDDAEHAPLPANPDYLSTDVATKDLKAMGLSACGKLGTNFHNTYTKHRCKKLIPSSTFHLVQDIYKDPNPPRIWNTEATRLVHIHILDPASYEAVTHIIPPPPPMDATEYTEANMPFYVVEEQVDNRVEGGDFENVISVSAMDKEKGVVTEPALDPSKPTMCRSCEVRLCDCVYVFPPSLPPFQCTMYA
jgi:hypothetical protein